MSEKGIIPIINIDDLGLAESNVLNAKQLQILFKATPPQHIYSRKAKGAGNWNYVTGTYVKKVLNLMFNFDWDFQVEKFEYNMDAKQCIVLGKLTVRTNGKTIIKNQFGRADIKFKNIWEGKKKIPTDQPLDLGNDLKAASTDALKKCASELGVAADIYAPNEFKAIKIVEHTQEEQDQETVDKRILEHIKQSKTADQLRQVANEIGDNEMLWEIYNSKFDELIK